MAGPVGRSAEAQTDAMMHAEILSWSRAPGVFAGITLTGSTMRPDKEDNDAIYGKAVSHKEILQGTIAPPTSAAPLYAALNKYMPTRPAKAAESNRAISLMQFPAGGTGARGFHPAQFFVPRLHGRISCFTGAKNAVLM